MTAKKKKPKNSLSTQANYERALMSNKAFAVAQTRREAVQGKKGAPSASSVSRAISKGRDNLSRDQVNNIASRTAKGTYWGQPGFHPKPTSARYGTSKPIPNPVQSKVSKKKKKKD